MNIARMLGMRPKDKHVSKFMSMALSLSTGMDAKHVASVVTDMSNMYMWIEEKADDRVKGMLGQFMAAKFSSLLIEMRSAGLAGKLTHTCLVAFLEMTNGCSKYRKIEYNDIERLLQRERAWLSQPKAKPVIVVTDEMITEYAKRAQTDR